LWRIRPRTTLFALGAVIVGAFAADHVWIRGTGIIAGELTAVSPIVQARLEQLFVQCLDRVTRGQRLAEFLNEATAQAAAQQLQQLQLQLTQARAQADIADRQAQVALKLIEAQRALLDQQNAILKAQDELVKQHYVAVLVWQQAKTAVERAGAETAAAQFVYETKKADQRMAELNAEVLQKRIDSFMTSPELTGHFYLTAPKDGIVTQCVAHQGEVIAARSTIFSIFNPDETYAIVFFDPSDITRIARGQTFNVNIQGIREPVTSTVTDFYPELSALPSSLTRYFWQQEMWSQYVPVRLDFVNLNTADRRKLLAWAQLSASRWEGLDANGLASQAWRWARRRANEAWQFVSAGYARQAQLDR
jgi:multidrug resistance efflux pump